MLITLTKFAFFNHRIRRYDIRIQMFVSNGLPKLYRKICSEDRVKF